jgi:hypothetical protein
MLLEGWLAMPGSALIFHVWMVCDYGMQTKKMTGKAILAAKAMGITGIDSVFQTIESLKHLKHLLQSLTGIELATNLARIYGNMNASAQGSSVTTPETAGAAILKWKARSSRGRRDIWEGRPRRPSFEGGNPTHSGRPCCI